MHPLGHELALHYSPYLHLRGKQGDGGTTAVPPEQPLTSGRDLRVLEVDAWGIDIMSCRGWGAGWELE